MNIGEEQNDYKKMKLTKNIQKYLNNKLLGGEINERGNRYENYYTTYKLIESFNSYKKDYDKIYFSSQENSFVDDLVITIKSHRHIFQLKTSKKLNWGLARKLKTLNFDFSIQSRIEKFKKSSYNLYLIVLKDNLKNKLPKQLKNCADVIMFPYNDSLQKQIINDAKFKKELVEMCAIDSPSVDKLESLAATILGAWGASNKKNICIENLYKNVELINYAFIKSREKNQLDDKVYKIINAIPSFKFVVHNNYFSWEYKSNDSGVIPHQLGSPEFISIENEIIRINPKDFITLEPIIS